MIIKTKLTPVSLLAIAVVFIALTCSIFMVSSPKQTQSTVGSSCRPNTLNCTSLTYYYCGWDSAYPDSTTNSTGTQVSVKTSIDFGCRATNCRSTHNCQSISPVSDLLYSLIRFLSIGVGLVIVASLTYAGIQYIGSRGEPSATEHAMNRIRANVIALIIYIFTFAILAYVVPPGYFL